MLKVDRDAKSFGVLETPTLAEVSISERYDLQAFICNSPREFFGEIGLELFLIGEEIAPSNTIQDRIDLLAMDKEGAAVVIELKRGNHKLHMMQAISYAGMISQWGTNNFVQLLNDESQEALADFLEVDLEEVNRRQRIILVAEAYDYALLVGAEWLSDQYGVDITCCRIAVAQDATTGTEYLVCSNVYPVPELAQEAAPRGRRVANSTKVKWPDWEAALAAVENSALVSYFERELSEGRESYLRKRAIHYRLDGKRRWGASARKSRAYVWQNGRFEGDVEFWQGKLKGDNDVKEVKRGKCLSFTLASEADLLTFHEATTSTLRDVEWLKGIGSDGGGDEELAGE